MTSDGSRGVHISAGVSVRLWKRSMTGKAPVELLRQPAWCPQIAPDDREALCWVMDPPGDGTIRILPLDGGDPRPVPRLPQGISAFRYGPDGRTITYLGTREGATELRSLPLSGGEARRPVRFGSEEIGDIAWSPERKRLAVVKLVRSGDVVLLKRSPA